MQTEKGRENFQNQASFFDMLTKENEINICFFSDFANCGKYSVDQRPRCTHGTHHGAVVQQSSSGHVLHGKYTTASAQRLC